MSDLKDGEPENRIINEPMSEALSKRYLAYALSTITARALPDVRGMVQAQGIEPQEAYKRKLPSAFPQRRCMGPHRAP